MNTSRRTHGMLNTDEIVTVIIRLGITLHMKCYGPFIEPVRLLAVVTRQIISTLHDSSRNLVSPLFNAQGRREYQLANVIVGRASEANHIFLLRDTEQ